MVNKLKLLISTYFLFAAILKTSLAYANDNFQKGIEAFEAKDYRAAIQHFSIIVNKDTTNAIAYFNRALCYEQLNNVDSAIYDLSKSYFLKPIDQQTKEKLLNNYFKRAMLQHDAKNYKAALQDFDAYLQIKPDDDVVIFNRGIILSKQEQKTQAIDEYTKAITLNAQTAYYFNRALDYCFLKEYTKALPDLNEVLKAQPKDTTALWLRAKIFYDNNELEKAQADLNVLKQLLPESEAIKDLWLSVTLTNFIEQNKYWGLLLLLLFILGMYFSIKAMMKK